MSLRYLPVVVCSEHDSPLDALLALHVAQDDAADAVAAALHACDGDFAPGFAVLAETDANAVASARAATLRAGLNEMLAAMREANVSIAHKAQVTAHNRLWPMHVLMAEIAKEHAAMTQNAQ